MGHVLYIDHQPGFRLLSTRILMLLFLRLCVYVFGKPLKSNAIEFPLRNKLAGRLTEMYSWYLTN